MSVSYDMAKDLEFFISHYDELVSQYRNKYVVIKNERVLNSYETLDSAIVETKKHEELGTFIVKKCDPGANNVGQTFHTRVVFSN